jgi:hypothetical protein
MKKSDYIKITKKEYNSLSDSQKHLCYFTKQKGKRWQCFKPKTLNKKETNV